MVFTYVVTKEVYSGRAVGVSCGHVVELASPKHGALAHNAGCDSDGVDGVVELCVCAGEEGLVQPPPTALEQAAEGTTRMVARIGRGAGRYIGGIEGGGLEVGVAEQQLALLGGEGLRVQIDGQGRLVDELVLDGGSIAAQQVDHAAAHALADPDVAV